MIRNFNDIIARASAKGGIRIAVTQAADKEVIESVVLAKEKGIAESLLIGDEAATIRLLMEMNEDPKDYTIIEASGHKDCANKAVECVKTGKADALMKGLIPTSTFFKPVLNKEDGLLTGRLISCVSVFEWADKNKLLFITDCVINVFPNLKQKKEILINGLELLKAFNYENPKIGILASVESVNIKMPETLDAAALSKMADRGEFGDAIVDGPLALDIAISKEALKTKGINSSVGGQADMLLAPCLNTGNALYKALVHFGKLSVAGTIIGAEVPIISTSRSDNVEAKLHSIALANLLVNSK